MEWETIAESTTVKVDEDDIALIYSTKICGVPIVCQTLSCIACIFMFVIETEVWRHMAVQREAAVSRYGR